jgi:hypothetical protein
VKGRNHRTEVTEVTEGEIGVDGRKLFGESRGIRAGTILRVNYRTKVTEVRQGEMGVDGRKLFGEHIA